MLFGQVELHGGVDLAGLIQGEHLLAGGVEAAIRLGELVEEAGRVGATECLQTLQVLQDRPLRVRNFTLLALSLVSNAMAR